MLRNDVEGLTESLLDPGLVDSFVSGVQAADVTADDWNRGAKSLEGGRQGLAGAENPCKVVLKLPVILQEWLVDVDFAQVCFVIV